MSKFKSFYFQKKLEKGIHIRHNSSVIGKNSTAGITLIALVITIIVLLILAGVTIATLTGENGILVQANYAQRTHIEAKMTERLELAIHELQIEKQGRATLDDITQEWLDEKMNDYESTLEDGETMNGKEIVLEEKGTTAIFIIDKNLNITEIKGNLRFKYEVGERNEENVKVTIKIQDKENGIEKIEIPNKETITPNGTKELLELEYEVQIGEEYKVIITLANGEQKEETIFISEYYHTITMDLAEEIKIDNTAVKAAYNKPYQAILAAEGEYIIDTLTVTMGGQAVSADKTTGLINIENVTGDIQITATAKKLEITVTEPIIAKTTTATSSVADHSQKDGTELYINFSATIEGNNCTVTPEVPFKITTFGTYNFTVTGIYNGKTLTKEIPVEVNKYQIYEIRTPQDLQNMGNDMSGTYFIMNDIDMKDFAFTPIEKFSNGQVVEFTGKLNGQGHTISNLTIASNSARTGMICYCRNTTFENILFKNVNISSTSSSTCVIAGSSTYSVVIRNVGITGNLTGTSGIGSFVGSQTNRKCNI